MTIQASLVTPRFLDQLSRKKNVVFIDAAVEQPDVLAQGVIPGAEVHFLSSDENAIAQITLALSDRTDLGAVHIISHGAPGRLLLGNGELNLGNLTQNVANLSAWFAASQANGPELLLYGCNVAAGDAGAEFIARLQTLSGATIAAASHTVGAASQGGQWDLDQGNTSTPLAITPELQAIYQGAFPLDVGDLAVVTYGADNDAGDDRFSLVALAEIDAGSTIFITDQGFDVSTGQTSTGETIITWVVGSQAIPAGTVITESNIGSFGFATGGTINFDADAGDQLLVFQTDDDTEDGTPSFIYGFNNNTDGADGTGWQTTASDINTSGVPAGTTVATSGGSGGTALGLIGEIDNAYYNGPTTGDKATLLTAISDPSNWVTNDEPDDESFDFAQAPTAFGVQNDMTAAGFLIQAPQTLDTTETGGTDTFTVRLATAPTEDVTLTFASTDETEATVSGPIVFDSSNWFEPQTVTVTGQNDDFDSTDGFYDITGQVSSTDDSYSSVDFPSISGITPDDDDAGFEITNPQGEFVPGTQIPLTSEAGDSYSFDIALTSEPIEDVTLTFTSSDPTEGTVTSSVLFTAAEGDTPSNWDTPQTVTVTGVQDSLVDGDVDYTLSATVTSDDSNYSVLTPPQDVPVRNSDDDTADVTFTAISGDTTEANAGTATFTVVLDSEPTADVTLSFTSSDLTEGTVTSSVIFSAAGVAAETGEEIPSNWDAPQTVTVTGVDEIQIDGDVAYTIQTTSQSNDAAFNGLTIDDVSVTNIDDDVISPKDFNADGLKDLLWVNNENGALAYWSILDVSDTPSSIANDFLTTDSTQGLDVIGTVDFNGDGQSDILIRDNQQDINKILLLDGTEQVEAITVGANRSVANSAWRMRAAGNFDDDAQTEILWRNIETGGFALWDIDGNNDATSTFVDLSAIGRGTEGALTNLDWEIQATGDIDGDGRDEIFWRNTATGGNAVWGMNESGGVESATFTTQLGNLEWNIIEVADYTNDGVVDIAWRNASNGQHAIWAMEQTNDGYVRASSSFIPSLTAANWSAANQQSGIV